MSLNTQRCPQCEALQNDRDMWHAAAQTTRSQCETLRTEADMLRQLLDTANAFIGEGAQQLTAALSERDALLTLLHDARPLLKGRLADDPSHGDPALLERIAAALDP